MIWLVLYLFLGCLFAALFTFMFEPIREEDDFPTWVLAAVTVLVWPWAVTVALLARRDSDD